MTLLSKASLLSVVASTFVAAVALLPTNAKATPDCLARPTAAAPSESHWYYRVDRVTNQRCWFLGMKRQIVRSAALQRPSDATNQHLAAKQTIAMECRDAPSGYAPPGKRWNYRTDRATARKCWRLGDRHSRRSPITRAQLPVPASRPETLSGPLPPSIAHAHASVRETVNEASIRKAIALSEARVPKEVTYEELLRSTFGSRWKEPFDTIRPSNLQSSLSADRSIDQPSSVVADVEVRSPERRDRLAEKGASPGDVVAALLVAAGSALVLLALFGRLLLFQGASHISDDYPPPLRVPSLESALEEPIHDNFQSKDASSERDRYGIPFSTLQVRRTAAGGASSHAARQLFTPAKTRPMTLTSQCNSRLEAAVE
jgi:hypothetical protein